MDINKSIITNLDHPEELFNLLRVNIDNKQLKRSIIYRGIYKLLEYNIDNAIIILEILKYEDNSLYALKIKAYSNNQSYLPKAVEIINILPKKLQKKRMYIPILKALIKYLSKTSITFFILLLLANSRINFSLEFINFFDNIFGLFPIMQAKIF